MASVIQRNLRVYKAMEVARIYQAFFLLHLRDPKLFTKLRTILLK